jgi:hypothetical protein
MTEKRPHYKLEVWIVPLFITGHEKLLQDLINSSSACEQHADPRRDVRLEFRSFPWESTAVTQPQAKPLC